MNKENSLEWKGERTITFKSSPQMIRPRMTPHTPGVKSILRDITNDSGAHPSSKGIHLPPRTPLVHKPSKLSSQMTTLVQRDEPEYMALGHQTVSLPSPPPSLDLEHLLCPRLSLLSMLNPDEIPEYVPEWEPPAHLLEEEEVMIELESSIELDLKQPCMSE